MLAQFYKKGSFMHVITYATRQYMWDMFTTPVHKCNLVTRELNGDSRRTLHCLWHTGNQQETVKIT